MRGYEFITDEPAIGTKKLIIEQQFELIRKHLFRRQDGTTGLLLDWKSRCPECGAEFFTTTVLGGGGPTRRCRAHRSGGRQVRPGPRRRLSIITIPPEVTA